MELNDNEYLNVLRYKLNYFNNLLNFVNNESNNKTVIDLIVNFEFPEYDENIIDLLTMEIEIIKKEIEIFLTSDQTTKKTILETKSGSIIRESNRRESFIKSLDQYINSLKIK